MGNADAAIELLTGYLEEKADDVQARTILGRCYVHKGRQSFAKSQFLQAFKTVQDNPGCDTLRSELANDIGAAFYYEKDLKEAEHWFSRAIGFDPRKQLLAYKNLAVTLVDQEKYEEALTVLQRSQNIFGNSKEVSSMSAHVHGLLGQYGVAISELTPLLSRDDCDAGVFASLGCYLADGTHDFTRARDVLRQAYERFPDNALIINNLAYTYLMLEDVQTARELLERHQTKPGHNVILTAPGACCI